MAWTLRLMILLGRTARTNRAKCAVAAIVSVCALNIGLGQAIKDIEASSQGLVNNRVADGASILSLQAKEAAGAAARYLENASDQDGRFDYRINTLSGQRSSKYNIVRHAGAIYALAQYDRAEISPDGDAAMLRAVNLLATSYMSPGPRRDILVIWATPLPQRAYVDLGATGLGLAALAAVRHDHPEAASIEELQGLGRFLLYLQRSDGSFINKVSMKTGPVSNFESLYYPGEAALGLLSLYELDGSQVWLNAAAKALSYLAKSRQGRDEVPADHWSLIAAAKMFSICRGRDCPVPPQLLIDDATRIATRMLRDQVRGETESGLDGAFDPDGRTAPTATRLEGLLAALEYLPESELTRQMGIAVERGIAFLLRTQIAAGPYAGGMPGSSLKIIPSGSDIRIDYVQHSLCAWLAYEQSNRSSHLAPPPKK